MIRPRRDRFTARNSVADSPNEIHGEAATKYGFGGGLVPGIALLAYVCESLRRATDDWACGGYVRLRYRSPVYDRQPIVVAIDRSESAPDASIAVTAANDVTAAIGVASLSGARLYSGSRPSFSRPPRHELPIPLTASNLLRTETLRPLQHTVSGSDVAKEFAGHGLDPAPYLERGIAPLASVAQSYFPFSDANFLRLGPSLLAESELLSLRPVPLDEPITIRGRIDRLFSRNGRGFVAVEVGWFKRAEILAWEVQTSIYDLG